MTCPRCQGLMASIALDDQESSPLGEPILGWRCLLCGEILDSVIVANRTGHREPMLDRARQHGAVVAVPCAPRCKETGE